MHMPLFMVRHHEPGIGIRIWPRWWFPSRIAGLLGAMQVLALDQFRNHAIGDFPTQLRVRPYTVAIFRGIADGEMYAGFLDVRAHCPEGGEGVGSISRIIGTHRAGNDLPTRVLLMIHEVIEGGPEGGIMRAPGHPLREVDEHLESQFRLGREQSLYS